MPRKEYKTITVKGETFNKFLRACRQAKKSDPEIDNSVFLEKLITKYRKKHR